MQVVSPVFYKEMVTLARRKRHFFLRTLLLSLLLATTWFAWRDAAFNMSYGGYYDLSTIGHSLFRMFVLTQFFAVLLIVPALTAPVIAAERANDTLGLLMMTNLSTKHLLLDKLLSRICLVTLLLFSGLPVMIVFLTFGGITPWQIVSSYLTIFATMLFCCGTGLYVSTLSNRMTSALAGTYFMLAGYVLGISALLLFISLTNHYGSSQEMVMTLLSLLPVSIVYEDLFSKNNTNLSYFVFPLISILVFVVAIIRCSVILPRIGPSATTSLLKKRFERINEYFRNINFTGINVMHEHTPMRGNGLVWKETQRRFCCSNIFLLRTSYVLVAISLILALPWGSSPDAALVLSSIHLSCIVIFTVILSATAFTMEKEKHLLDVLMSTSISGQLVVLAKFLGVLKSVSVVTLVPLVTLLINFVPGWNWASWHWFQGLLSLCTAIAAFLPVVIVIGFYFSLVCRRSATAMTATFFAVLAWILVPLLLAFALDIFCGSDCALGYLQHLSPAGSLHLIFYPGESMTLMFIMLSFTGVWVLMLLLLIHRFDMLVGRI